MPVELHGDGCGVSGAERFDDRRLRGVNAFGFEFDCAGFDVRDLKTHLRI